jgi:stage II sporulation protein D
MLKKSLITLVMVLLVSAFSTVQAAEQSPPIRIGIWSNQANIILSADSDFSLVDSDTKESIGQFHPKDKVTVSYKEARIAINGNPVNAQQITVVLPEKGAKYIEVNRRAYRGEITIHRTKGKSGLTVVNTLPVEEYLYGIIAREISPEWPLEAVKAQAVAARTYALYNMGKHADDGYDLCPTTDCQVYGGYSSEDPRAIRAVNDTYGQAVFYNGRLISTFFHSDGGGYTENSENVWGNYLPYLRGVADYDQKSPHYRWEKQLKTADMEDTLRSAGYNIGSLQGIELSPLTKQPVDSPDRGVSGRIKSLRLLGTKGSVQLTGSKFRSIFGLDSSLFDIKVLLPNPDSIEVEITDSYGDRDVKKVDINVPPMQSKVLEGHNIRRLTGRDNETVVFNGYGWGHGLGLSQWGAKAMAEAAPPGDATYFKEILKHYYTGVEVLKAY